MPEAPRCGTVEVIREGEDITLRINCEACPFFPSLEDNPRVMAMVMDALAQTGTATKIVLVQKRDYEYDYNQTSMLLEIAKLFKQLSKERLSAGILADPLARRFIESKYVELQDIIHRSLKSDPLGAYVELVRIARREHAQLEKGIIPRESVPSTKAFLDLVETLINRLDKTRLITLAKPGLAGYTIGDRTPYRTLFSPMVKPDFMFTKLLASYPIEGEEIDSYPVGESEVAVFSIPETVQYLYHLSPPEFRLDEEKYELLDAARKILAEHKPKRSEFVDPERMRQVFTNVGTDLLEELASYRGIRLREKELEELSKILVRYTVGFGLIELLLEDERVQDITINSPMGRTPVFIVHADYGDCMTNIIPTTTEAESWASKLRMISGRPLDEANPILDTELVLPTARARVAAITAPLNPTGLAYALRRHRDKPWTLPLYIKNRMITPLAAGIMSFLIDGSRTMLVAGTRSAGKTSFLGAIMTEIMRKGRIVTIEDSVTGDSRIVVERNGRLERTTVGELVDGLISQHGHINIDGREFVRPPEPLRIYAIDKNGKVKLARVSQCMRHKVTKPIYEVRTASGRCIKVTGDHALFTIGTNELFTPVRASELCAGDFIVTPRALPNEQKPKNEINLLKHARSLPNSFFQGQPIREIISARWTRIKTLAKKHKYGKSASSWWKRAGILPCTIFAGLNTTIPQGNIKIKKKGSSTSIPARIALTPEIMTLIGLWLAGGRYDKNSIIISTADERERAVVRDAASQLGIKPQKHSNNTCLVLNSKILKDVFQNVLQLDGDAHTKRVPGWVFGLAKDQIAHSLKGLLGVSSCATGKEIVVTLASEGLLNDIQTLLLQFGIIMRTSQNALPDKTFTGRIDSTKMLSAFPESTGFLQEYKQQSLKTLCTIPTHDATNIMPLEGSLKTTAVFQSMPNTHDYIARESAIGQEQLSQAVCTTQNVQEAYSLFANSDIFWDRVVSVERADTKETYVYDFSVPGFENFVCENILAHNTLELPVDALRKLNYNIQSMKVASALTRGTTEVSADEGIRTTLRLGDSSLIIGEVRSVEAKALYEAMRVGALANVVAGTIHGDSPYGVFDRVVNDLGVPRTSFKATDILIIANPVRSPDGLRRFRRITQITEVRKKWEQDPLTEGGFSDLMKYDSKDDMLQPSKDLLAGDSDVIKAIASTVREWAGNWEAVWDNILLRANVKQELVSVAEKLKRPELLEANFSVLANDEFHRISERTREELGALDSKRIFAEWTEWLKRAVKKPITTI